MSENIVAAAKEVMATHACNVVAKALVKKFVFISLSLDKPTSCIDHISVHAYTQLSFPMGLLWHGFHDSAKHRNGDRIIPYWKFLMVLFKEEGLLIMPSKALVWWHGHCSSPGKLQN